MKIYANANINQLPLNIDQVIFPILWSLALFVAQILQAFNFKICRNRKVSLTFHVYHIKSILLMYMKNKPSSVKTYIYFLWLSVIHSLTKDSLTISLLLQIALNTKNLLKKKLTIYTLEYPGVHQFKSSVQNCTGSNIVMIYPHKANVVQLWVSLFTVRVHGSVNSKTIGSCIMRMTNPPVMFTFFYGFQLADKEKAKKSKQTILDLLWCIKGQKKLFKAISIFLWMWFLTQRHFNNNGIKSL